MIKKIKEISISRRFRLISLVIVILTLLSSNIYLYFQVTSLEKMVRVVTVSIINMNNNMDEDRGYRLSDIERRMEDFDKRITHLEIWSR